MRRLGFLASLFAALLGNAGCVKHQVSLAKGAGVAVVDLDRVAEEVGRDRVIRTSGTDFRDEVKPIAEKIANERGMNTVVTKDNPFVLSYGPNADITDAVIQKIKHEEPAAEESSPQDEEENESQETESRSTKRRVGSSRQSKGGPQMEAPQLNM